ncbi:MAG: hypothetical protein ACXU82_13175 [Caulobacteraceae bacterium]
MPRGVHASTADLGALLPLSVSEVEIVVVYLGRDRPLQKSGSAATKASGGRLHRGWMASSTLPGGARGG